MRTNRRTTWLIFAVCALLLIDGLGWVTWQVLRLERSERFARQDAQLQEAVRLSLWRMDGMLSPIIAAETSRPYFQYRAFYPASRAYNQMWEPVGAGEVLVPSPLLSGPDEYIRLHFESTPEGWLTSPQAPDPALRDRLNAESLPLADMLTVERRLIELNSILRGGGGEQDLGRATANGDAATNADDTAPPEVDASAESQAETRRLTTADPEQELRAFAKQREAADPGIPDTSSLQDMPPAESESDRSVAEFEARQQNIARAQSRNDKARQLLRDDDEAGEMKLDTVLESSQGGGGGGSVFTDAADAASRYELAFSEPPDSRGEVTQGRFTPVWRSNPTTGADELLFVRVVTVNGRELLQGFWIDWPALRADLLASVRDLLPDADLKPVRSMLPGGRLASTRPPGLTNAGQLLASVPAALSPGALVPPAISTLSPTRIVLVVAWLAVIAAVVAIGLVLRASLALSERRGRFASAVTHELRTPLTTFCLYSQMLADGMVQGEEKRAEYLGTLRREAERLATIVENVLVYTRTGSRASPAEFHDLRALLDSVTPSFAQRAEQSGMRLEVDADTPPGLAVATDAASLDRVLGNLIDNACKYAAEADDRRIVLRVRQSGHGVEFRVRDFGPGIAPRERRRVFSPFTRARVHADDGSSGLGLGLALARSVARSLGGDLRLTVPTGPGAEFVLWLPGSGSGSGSA